MGIGFDSHEVTALAKAFEDATGGPAVADVGKVVFRGAIQIKRDAARRISGHPRWRRLPYAIDFDMYVSLKGPAAEIGPNHAKPQGKLGNIPEYGSPTSPPIPYMAPAATAEEPKFAKAIEDLAARALEP